jgi:hypothetical protein
LITRAPSAGVVLPCPAGATGVFAVGEMVYYDTSEGVVVNYAAKAGNILCGFALEIAELADEEVRVDFDGIIGKGATE